MVKHIIRTIDDLVVGDTYKLNRYSVPASVSSELITSFLSQILNRAAIQDRENVFGYYNTPPVLGDITELARYIIKLPNGVTVNEAWWTVKQSYTDPDVAAEFMLGITTTPSDNGVIINNPDGTIQIQFIATPNSTTALNPLETYYYDIKLMLSDLTEYTCELGKLFTLGSVTDLT
jgi:hypothetical protein